MKSIFISLFVGLLAISLFTGCVLNLGSGGKTNPTCREAQPVTGQPMVAPTLGQQLMDLQKAKDAGALSDQEYQEQKAKLLGTK